MTKLETALKTAKHCITGCTGLNCEYRKNYGTACRDWVIADICENLVRCKDCKDWNWGFPIGGSDLCLCKAHGGFYEADDFCSYGERRESE